MNLAICSSSRLVGWTEISRPVEYSITIPIFQTRIIISIKTLHMHPNSMACTKTHQQKEILQNSIFQKIHQ